MIVVENAPLYQGQQLALTLAKENIQTTVINDSAVFAMMSRVNKVIIETHSVMANGGSVHLLVIRRSVSNRCSFCIQLICSLHILAVTLNQTKSTRLKAQAGSNALALAAHYHSVPLIVCSAMYQLSPQYLCSYDGFNKFSNPQEILDFVSDSKVEIANPAYDYVPPELVTLFITNK